MLYGVAASIIMLVTILVSAIGTHGYIPQLRRPQARGAYGVAGIFRQMVETLSNRSFVALFVAGVFGAMGVGISSALMIYINTYFWEPSSDQSADAAAVRVRAAGRLWPRSLSIRLGKKRAAIAVSVAALVLSPAPIALRLMGLFPPTTRPCYRPSWSSPS